MRCGGGLRKPAPAFSSRLYRQHCQPSGEWGSRSRPEGARELFGRKEIQTCYRKSVQRHSVVDQRQKFSTAKHSRVRSAVVADCAELHEIERLCRGFWTERELKAELGEDRTVLLVAETREDGEEPRVSGMVLVWCVADEAQVLELAVHPRAQGQGLGLRLMEEALAISTVRVKQRAGRGAAVLEVGVNNTAALALYTRLGFKRVGYRRGYYPDGTDAVLMRLPIS